MLRAQGSQCFLLFVFLVLSCCIAFGRFGELLEEVGVKRGFRKSCGRQKNFISSFCYGTLWAGGVFANCSKPS